MTTIKTSELTGPALDWAVMLCEHEGRAASWLALYMKGGDHRFVQSIVDSPSKNWDQGGPIIQREKVWVKERFQNTWDAFKNVPYEPKWKGVLVLTGTTYLEAAMRCYVASKMGETVEVPDELMV